MASHHHKSVGIGEEKRVGKEKAKVFLQSLFICNNTGMQVDVMHEGWLPMYIHKGFSLSWQWMGNLPFFLLISIQAWNNGEVM